MNKIIAFVWLAIAIIAIVGVIAKGAYWHLGTAGISLMMGLAMIPEKGEE